MRKSLIAAVVAAVAVGGLTIPSAASPGDSSLPGSKFEIEADANITVDTALSGVDDWVEVPSTRIKPDQPTGSADDSFGNGTKEDTPVPSVIDGSIPPNKSDLKEFGTYQEGTTTDGFFHLFWSRVQDPSGTTNMDFELNQSDVLSTNGITPVRTEGDLLITYDLSRGGTRATISIRTWDGSAWGPATSFADSKLAIGTINTSTIELENGLGPYSPRTFGEASVDMGLLFDNTTECQTFGSAYLKSRSSDSFTAAVKDFIAPAAIDLTNCGQVIIQKADDAGSPLAGAEFTLFSGTTNTGLKCSTVADGTCTISNVPFGTYTVRETVTPAGYESAADQSATVGPNTPTVTLSFVDPRQRGAIKVAKTYGSADTPQAGVSFTVNGVTQQTDASGYTCFDNLLFGTYAVSETVPANFVGEGDKNVTVDNAATCADATYVGETVAFSNTPLSKIEVSFGAQVTGATDATIACVKGEDTLTPDATDDRSGWDRNKRYEDLTPGTYTCTVVIS